MVFLKNSIRGDIRKKLDSAQANTAYSQTPRRVRIRAVLACAESEKLIFENLKLANTARSSACINFVFALIENIKFSLKSGVAICTFL